MRRQTTKSAPELKNTNHLALQLLNSFITYCEKISALNGDGTLKVNGKQATVAEFEDAIAASKEALVSESGEKKLVTQDLYDVEKIDELRKENGFKSSDPKIEVKCRITPKSIEFEYGIQLEGFNFRQLVLINNAFLEAGIEIMGKYHGEVSHNNLGKLFNEALHGVDFSKMGMAKAGENQINNDFLLSLRERSQQMTAAIEIQPPKKANSLPSDPNQRSGLFGRLFQKPTAEQEQMKQRGKEIKKLEKEIKVLQKDPLKNKAELFIKLAELNELKKGEDAKATPAQPGKSLSSKN